MIFIDNTNLFTLQNEKNKPRLYIPKLATRLGRGLKIVSPSNIPAYYTLEDSNGYGMRSPLPLGFKLPCKGLCYLSAVRNDPERVERYANFLARNNIYPRIFYQNPNRKKEKEVDTALTTDLIYYGLKDEYDIAIVVAGDRDYKYPIEKIQKEGKKVKIAFYKEGLSSELKEVVSDFIDLDEFVEDNPDLVVKRKDETEHGTRFNSS